MDLSWNHNVHYHEHLLRHVPDSCVRALDVGCGAGRFARRLAARAAQVEAIDPDPAMIAEARRRTPRRMGVHYVRAALDDFGVAPGAYQFVSALASIHHMPFADSLRVLARGLAPGGVLAVLGCYREESPADYAVSAAALVPQWSLGAGLRAARALTGVPDPTPAAGSGMRVREPDMGLAEIRAEAARVLPGARVRRLLFWRYCLVYARPVTG
ncbi:class I SAM-dependent methyltransferase [Streptomonospora sp. S1-112]|uniref:Class I SAM-dependent methyltransferase n=1 Tax=Streptomonospora mangrovi TaxID=2883123 RepID=A0A9X3NNI2_9ACTN|nr:class I SAM-dependent methyltransferase [Streptomonospora mangrovi]MDA0567019.1 class I SAM-dependent methyltransferase [Streptomonospora mangrovi]